MENKKSKANKLSSCQANKLSSYRTKEPSRYRVRVGQTTLEVIVALTLLTLALTSAALVVLSGQSLNVDSEEASVALRLAEQNLELNKASARNDFNGLVSATTIQAEFTKEIVVATTTDSDTKQIISRVSWSTDHLRAQKVEVATLVTNWSGAQSTGGDTGGSGPTGNWCSPQTLGNIDLGAGVSGTDIDVKNKIAYITGTASTQSKPDFFVVDVSNGGNPAIISSLNTGTGLNGLDVAGNYAYVVGSDDSKEFQVIDVSSSSSPSVVAALNLAGSADGLSIFYRNGYVYVGRANGAAQEFQIIDVSNPLSPTLVSGISDVGDEINRIYVYNNRAYIGTEDNSRGMIIIDVSNPSSPQNIGYFNTGTHVYGIYAQSDSRVYLGAKTNFWIVDASVASSVVAVGSSSVVHSGDKIRDIALAFPYAFIATEDSNKEYQALNISDPKNITVCGTFNFPNRAVGIDYENNLVYTAVRSNDGLRIVTSQ